MNEPGNVFQPPRARVQGEASLERLALALAAARPLVIRRGTYHAAGCQESPRQMFRGAAEDVGHVAGVQDASFGPRHSVFEHAVAEEGQVARHPGEEARVAVAAQVNDSALTQ